MFNDISFNTVGFKIKELDKILQSPQNLDVNKTKMLCQEIVLIMQHDFKGKENIDLDISSINKLYSLLDNISNESINIKSKTEETIRDIFQSIHPKQNETKKKNLLIEERGIEFFELEEMEVKNSDKNIYHTSQTNKFLPKEPPITVDLNNVKKQISDSYYPGEILKNYGIEDQKIIEELADWIVDNCPERLCFFLRDIVIKDIRALEGIAVKAIKLDFELIFSFVNKLDDSIYTDLFFKNLPHDFSKLQRYFKDGEIECLPKQLPSLESCFNKIGCSKWFTTFSFIEKKKEDKLATLTDDEKTILLWAISSAVLLSSKNVESLPTDTQKIWKAIFDYRDPNMRYELSKRVCSLSDSKAYETYKKLTKEKAHLILPCLFLLLKKELSETSSTDLISKLASLRSQLRDAGILRVVLDTLKLVSETKELNGNEIRTILNIVLDTVVKSNDHSQKLKQGCFLLQGIFYSGAAEKLKTVSNWDAIEELSTEALQTTFSGIKVEKFNEKYLSTFAKCRNLPALLIYAGKMKMIEEEAIDELNKYVKSVMEGTIKEDRYNVKNNKHLEIVFGAKKGLEEKWMKNTEESIAKDISKETTGITIVNTDDYWDLFICGTETFSCQRVDGNPSINKHLIDYPVDGKIRLIAIKENDGTIVARCIIRLLWDDENKCPILMQEKNYFRTKNSDFDKRLNEYTEKFAKHLEIPLYRAGSGKETKISVCLKSFNSVARSEYVDSAGVHAAETDGKYVIIHAERIL